MSCAKAAEPIEIPLGLWVRVLSSNHVLDGVQIVHANGQFLRGKDMPVHARRHCAVNCAKMAEPIEMSFVL